MPRNRKDSEMTMSQRRFFRSNSIMAIHRHLLILLPLALIFGMACDSSNPPVDSDQDGVADLMDAFPDDPTETADDDGDSVGNNADIFPNDPTETEDGDGDGVGDNGDAFPDDPTETADDDGDSVGNNADAFPQDDTESADTDADGVGDRLDAYPEDSEEATYGSEGSYVVGVTTLSMGDRDLEVFYPAENGSQDGVEPASYDQIDPFPQNIQDLIISLAPGANATVVLPAYRDLPSSSDGSFPVIIFSHGSGGFPRAYSKLLAGISSHGFIVAAINHLEWGLLDRLGLGLPEEDQREADELVLSTLALLDSENQDPASLLAGASDTNQVATAGHSAGGIAAFAFPTQDNPEIKTLIGYATIPFLETPEKPVLLLLGAEDFAITTEATLSSYDALIETKRYVAVTNAGHNSFTDQCEIIHDGNDIIAAAQLIFGAAFPESLAALARDGCLPENLAPSEFWSVTQHYTVAHLRRVFSLNEEPRGLTAPSADLFDEIEIDYRYEEE
jgi:predicted dienelactone hydrolase